MFARTERLTLRPAWPEDAATLAAALGDARVSRMLALGLTPQTDDGATAAIPIPRAAAPRGAHDPRFVIESLGGGTPRLVGGIVIHDRGDGPELDYWMVPDARGHGFATEAGRAVIDMARHALPIDRLRAWHFADDPASGRVLRKLGFRPTGTAADRHAPDRPTAATALEYMLDLDDDRTVMPIAA